MSTQDYTTTTTADTGTSISGEVPTTYEIAVHLVKLRTKGRYTRPALVRAMQQEHGVTKVVAERAVKELVAGGALEVRVDPAAKQMPQRPRVFVGARSIEGALQVQAVAAREAAAPVRVGTRTVAPEPSPSPTLATGSPPQPQPRRDGRVQRGHQLVWPDEVIERPVTVDSTRTNPVPIEERGVKVGDGIITGQGMQPRRRTAAEMLDGSTNPYRHLTPPGVW